MPIKNKYFTVKIAPFILAAFCNVSHAQNLIGNGSFENGSSTGWQTSGPWNVGGAGNIYFDSPTDGNWALQAGEYYAWPEFFRLWQYIPTEINKNYSLSFDFAAINIGFGTNPMNFGASFDNQSITPESLWPTDGSYTSYSQEFTATQSNSLVMFTFHQRGGTYVMAIDNIQVSPIASNVPEPNTALLALIGIGVIAPLARKFRSSAKERASHN